jgi:hypothetical protein
MNMLFEYNVNYKAKNHESIKPIEIASTFCDFETICLLVEYILKKKHERIEKGKIKIQQFLNNMQNFYIEMKWEVRVPLFSFLCPSDICKIWKFGENIRLDYSFANFKKYKVKRVRSSFIFKSGEYFLINWKHNTFYNPFEELDQDEKLLIIRDIMNNNHLHTQFKFYDCKITPSTNWQSKPVYDKINHQKTQKYDINISTSFALQNSHKYEYMNLNKDAYFREDIMIGMKIITMTNTLDLTKNIKNEKIKEELKKLKKGNNYKASVWITDDFPLKSSNLYELLESLQNANELTRNLKKMIENPDIKKIIEKNGFPVKINIPINMLISVNVSFQNYNPLKTIKSDLFDIPSEVKRISRKQAQKLKENSTKRLAYVNF